MIDVYIEKINIFRYKELRDWCFNNLGQIAWYIQQLEDPLCPNVRWYAESKTMDNNPYLRNPVPGGGAMFSFRDGEDATAFKLRFGL